MEFGISFSAGMVRRLAVNEALKHNDYTRRFGLTLTDAQAAELVETRTHALSAGGRVEFGGGVISKIIREFCDSPYISMHNYALTLHELVEMFYYYKSEAMDLIGDDELIAFMKKAFDGVCQGSLELLAGRELYRLAENLRFGRPAIDREESVFGEDADE